MKLDGVVTHCARDRSIGEFCNVLGAGGRKSGGGGNDGTRGASQSAVFVIEHALAFPVEIDLPWCTEQLVSY